MQFRGSNRSDYLNYISLPKKKMEGTLTRNFFYYLKSLEQEYSPDYFFLDQIYLYEKCVLDYLRYNHIEITENELISFFRGSKMIPDEAGDMGYPEETQYWLIEGEDIQKILLHYPLFDFKLLKKFIPMKYYKFNQQGLKWIKKHNLSTKYVPKTPEEFKLKIIENLQNFFNFVY